MQWSKFFFVIDIYPVQYIISVFLRNGGPHGYLYQVFMQNCLSLTSYGGSGGSIISHIKRDIHPRGRVAKILVGLYQPS